MKKAGLNGKTKPIAGMVVAAFVLCADPAPARAAKAMYDGAENPSRDERQQAALLNDRALLESEARQFQTEISMQTPFARLARAPREKEAGKDNSGKIALYCMYAGLGGLALTLAFAAAHLRSGASSIPQPSGPSRPEPPSLPTQRNPHRARDVRRRRSR